MPLRHMKISDVFQKRGIETGGPSPEIFGPHIYPAITTLDSVNFSSKTTWEGSIQEGNTFVFHRSRPPGRQYIREATALVDIPSPVTISCCPHTRWSTQQIPF